MLHAPHQQYQFLDKFISLEGKELNGLRLGITDCVAPEFHRAHPGSKIGEPVPGC